MSKEREEAYRAMHEYVPGKAPLIKNVNENALSAIWASDSRVMVNGKWYVSISDVSEILYNKDQKDPEDECCGQGCCDHEMNQAKHEEEILFEELKAEKIREWGNTDKTYWEPCWSTYSSGETESTSSTDNLRVNQSGIIY